MIQNTNYWKCLICYHVFAFVFLNLNNVILEISSTFKNRPNLQVNNHYFDIILTMLMLYLMITFVYSLRARTSQIYVQQPIMVVIRVIFFFRLNKL